MTSPQYKDGWRAYYNCVHRRDVRHNSAADEVEWLRGWCDAEENDQCSEFPCYDWLTQTEED